MYDEGKYNRSCSLILFVVIIIIIIIIILFLSHECHP